MKMNRRQFVRNVSLGTASLGVGELFSSSTIAPSINESNETPAADNDGQVLFVGDDIAIANTEYGKIQGYQLHGIYTFLGIPYGADTTGANRFMPPKKPTPWTDIRPAAFYGDTAPQHMEKRFQNNFGTFADHWNYYDVSENCLCLNVWTPGIADGKKRPVMVWMHGGGYTNGNGIEQDGYHGENLSKAGNIVFVSVNHRLGPIGYSDLSSVGGEKYKDSGNVGMLDLIAALQWVHDNITNFGGDPGNVTIMGQSGGGAKVCTVAAMPAAKGLVHKGVALSGSAIKGGDPKISKEIGEEIVKQAGLTADTIDKLQEMPWKDYLDLADKAAKIVREREGGTGFGFGFSPVADGRNIPAGQFWTGADADNQPSIPMIFSTTFHEMNPDRTNPKMELMTKADVVKALQARYPQNTESIYDGYAKAFPGKRPIELFAMISANRQGVIRSANAKLKQGQPVYVDWFGWCPPLFNNRMRAFHCLDICFWFRNTDRMYTHTGGGARPRKLSNAMSAALLNFMRTGNPNGGTLLPNWPKYTAEKGETMVLNDTSKAENDPDGPGRKLLPG